MWAIRPFKIHRCLLGSPGRGLSVRSVHRGAGDLDVSVLVSVVALVTRPGLQCRPGAGRLPLPAMLRTLLPLRPALRNAARSFHPLAGQSLTEPREKWANSPSANLVPIVIEQTVFSRVSHSAYSHISTRAEESVRMIFSPASYEKES